MKEERYTKAAVRRCFSKQVFFKVYSQENSIFTRRTRIDPCGLRFHFFQGSYLLSHETSSFFTDFSIAEPFNLDNVIHFCKSKKGLSSSVFTIKILVTETFSCY